MRRAKLLATARRDLKDAFDYIAEQSGSEAVANKFLRRLHAQCHKLAGLSATVGRPRPELRADLRSFPYHGYVIFFRYVENRFEVVNILEGHRDVGGQIGADEGS